MYMVIQYRSVDYIIEIFIAGISALLVYKIYKSDFFRIDKRKYLKGILVAGLVLRVIMSAHDFYNRPVQTSDYEKHERLGARIAFENRYYDFTGIELYNYRQPGLPFIFAVGLLIVNDPFTCAVIMMLFSFGVIVSGYYLFKDYVNTGGIISFAYLCLSPNMLFMASNSNTQLPFFFFLILLFIVLKNYSGKTYQLIFIGILAACEIYIRFNFLMLLILIPFIIQKHSDRKLIYSAGKLGLIFLTCFIVYSPWIYRNYLIYGTVRIMPTLGLNLYSSTLAKDYTKAGGYSGVPEEVLKKYSNLSEIEFDKALKEDVYKFIKENPVTYLKGIPFKIFKYSGRQDWTITYFFDNTLTKYPEFAEDLLMGIENFFFWVILFFPLLYLFKIRKSGGFAALPVYMLWSYLTYTMAVMPGSETRARYNFPYILFPVFAVAFIDRQKNDEVKEAEEKINEEKGNGL